MLNGLLELARERTSRDDSTLPAAVTVPKYGSAARPNLARVYARPRAATLRAFRPAPAPQKAGAGVRDRAVRARRLRRLGLALLALGVACRLLRYALRFPYWGDEAFLCVNFLDRDYLGLTRQLECFQVAPVLFLWGELTALRLLGSSEWALRLLPLAAGLASLGLMWRLARISLGLRTAVLAVGLLAVSRWPVTMCTSVKPYSLDLFFSLTLLLGAVQYLRNPQRVGWLALLTLVVPVALLSSYPAVFVAGGVGLVLLPAAWRGGRGARGWFIAYLLLTAGTFVGAYLLVGLSQLDPEAGSVRQYMQAYWKHGFPPAGVWPFAAWLARVNAGRLMAYPTGDARGGSTLTLLVFLLGTGVLAARQRWSFLGLCLLPFALNFVAAALHRYPYGGCCRISQHLAPAVCLLAAAGLSRLIDYATRSVAGRLRGVYVCCAALALFGLGQAVADIARPYRDAEALWALKVSRLLQNHGAGDAVVIANRRGDVESLLRWHLGRPGLEYRWGGRVDWEELERGGGDLWYVRIASGTGPAPREDVGETPAFPSRPGWSRAEHAVYTLTPWSADQPYRRCEVSRWTRSEKIGGADGRPALSSWPP
jgi:hypothetical protein